ncbi:MAG: class I SAM-dependent methyltransferase [Rickettsiales bacterium]
MNDQRQTGAEHWKGRTASWTSTAATGLSTDDTFNQMIIEHADLQPGECVLDLGSGTGDPAISIGLMLGDTGRLIACDLTLEMLAHARTRATNVGIANIGFAAADMQAIPFSAGRFDAVTCRFGLMFSADKVTAAAEARRVLRPGGRVAFVVWGHYEENPSFFVLRRAMAAAVGEDERPPPQRHSLGVPGLLTDILTRAGFEKVEERELLYERRVDDLDDYITRGLRRGYSDTLDRLNPAEQAELVGEVRDAFEPWRRDGVIHMPNSARLGLGFRR